MKHTVLFVFILLLSVLVFAQESDDSQVVKGKVVDAASGNPVAYANIGIVETLHGTASDAEGNFLLKIPASMTAKNIYFSVVGYKNRQFPVQKLFGQQLSVVKLQPQSYDVGDVDVEAQNMVIQRILRTAFENICYNYGSGPFNLHLSYSKHTVQNDSVNTNVSASVLLYDKTGYSKPSVLDAFGSRNYKVTKADEAYSFASEMLKIDEMLALDWVRSASCVISPALFSDYQVKIESQPEIDGKEYWVIAFSQKKPSLEGSGDFYASDFEGTITICKDDYSVRNIKGKVKAPKNNRQDRSLAVAGDNADFLKNVTYNFSVDYLNLLVKQVALNKSYTYKGDTYSENTTMKVTRSHTNNLTVLDSRDYFVGR